MERREFLAKAGIAATWAGVAVRIGACSDDPMSSNGGTGGSDAVGSVTGSDHSHTGAVVTRAELDAGNAVTLTLSGGGHTHTASVSSQQVMDIASGQTVMVQSTQASNGHDHTVTFN